MMMFFHTVYIQTSHGYVKSQTHFARLFLHYEQRRREKKKKSLHFPACFGAGHACDVTKSIYTAAGKNFFLYCYIVTNGAGAERGERRLLVTFATF